MSREDVRFWTKPLGSRTGKPAPIAFTSGAFDILHPGHIEYLYRAARLDSEFKYPCPLVVGINSDESVRKYKKPNIVPRPFNSLEYRIQTIAALGCVDYVFPFEEEDNNENIEILRPRYYIKGGDYTKDKLKSAPFVESYGGQVVIIPITENYSTTEIMRRLVNEARNLQQNNDRERLL